MALGIADQFDQDRLDLLAAQGHRNIGCSKVRHQVDSWRHQQSDKRKRRRNCNVEIRCPKTGRTGRPAQQRIAQRPAAQCNPIQRRQDFGLPGALGRLVKKPRRTGDNAEQITQIMGHGAVRSSAIMKRGLVA